jgi:hypothetical protein
MKNWQKIVLTLLFPITVLSGQGMISDQPKMLFSNEQTFGLFLNSNGLGADYRFASYISARKDRIFEASFDYVKHPKEYRSVVAYDFYTRRFVYGKENLFWELKGQIGNQHEIYRKYDLSSVSIKMTYSGGVSLGFQKPIYYEIVTFSGNYQIIDREEKKFDPAIHLYNYGGTASFTKGFDELSVIPGLTINTGINFEYSEREPMVHALEAGIGLTVYPKNIRIMATEKNSFYFFNLYIGYRFGTMIDISDAARAKTWKERRQERRMGQPQIPLLHLL